MRDFDNDGYYNWGVGQRISGCGEPNEQDSDDYNPRIGPFDDNYYGEEVAPLITVYRGFGIEADTIEQNGFYLFHNLTGNPGAITFNIRNNGDAQLVI